MPARHKTLTPEMTIDRKMLLAALRKLTRGTEIVILREDIDDVCEMFWKYVAEGLPDWLRERAEQFMIEERPEMFEYRPRRKKRSRS